MKSGFFTLTQAVALSGGLLIAPLAAQEASESALDTSMLIEMAKDDAAQDFLELTGSELADILANASDIEIAELIAALSEDDVQALVIRLAQGTEDAALLADIIAAVIENDPEATNSVIGTIAENVDAAVLPTIASNLFDEISGRCGGYDQVAMTGMALTTLSFDTSTAENLVVLGNNRGGDCAASLSVALAEITETGSNLIASAIETALALEGGAMLQLVSLARGEGDVAAIPDTATPVAAAAPAVAPAAIGGGGATPGGGAPGTSAFVQNSGSTGAGVAGGPAFVPAGGATIVSPDGSGS